jgi:hypothetical protein
MVDERDKARARMGLPPVVASGTPFGQAGGGTPSTVTGTSANMYGAPTETVVIDGKSYTGVNPTKGKPPAATVVGMVSPSSGLTITGTERNFAKEKEALDIGYTKEYIASRGGINAQGYFNDTPISRQLTAEEQRQVRKPDGTTDTKAMADILQKKQIADLIASGVSEKDATARVSAQYGEFGVPVPGSSDIAGTDTAGAAGASNISKETRDAFALLDSTFALYGLSDLAPVIAGYMRQGLTSNEAIIELRKNKTYQTRFAGNTTRVAAGLNALTEGEYLALEDSYSETLRAYGQQSLLGTDKKARQASMANIIGGDISPVEFKDRVSTVVDRVENADPLVKSTLRDFYKITDTELVSYFLNPKENLPKLQEKVTAAEIGSAAIAQGGLTTDMTSAESLAKFGVDLATARKGYSTISQVLPTATKLSQIYDEENIQYDQKVAEEEVFKGLASAQRKRTQLAEKEIASFQGSSGVGAAGLSTTYLRKGSAAGQF